VDVSARGSGADYLVGAERVALEVAGRSRRVDLEAAWQQKRTRFERKPRRAHFICVVEVETPAGRLGFFRAEEDR
jgi:hypothetical protein